MKRLLAAAVLATLTHTALAGELTLFGDSDFRGPRITVQGDVRDLRALNFNDITSSVVVRSGVWELCQDSNFGGRCARFGPGEYRVLPDFNDAISSARELRGPGGPGGAWRDGDGDARREEWREHEWREHEERREERRDEMRGGGAVELFAGPRFEGPEVGVSGDVRSLDDLGFNDRAVSLIIHEGRWEFCEHGDFRGQCMVFGPGRYPFLEGMNNRISSMRRVR